MTGATSALSLVNGGFGTKTRLGEVSEPDARVVNGFGSIPDTMTDVQPTGSAGAATVSKNCVENVTGLPTSWTKASVRVGPPPSAAWSDTVSCAPHAALTLNVKVRQTIAPGFTVP
ncbi:MAG: hypothetical protein FJW27_14700 [Acidimicrobiia bacterium]|nr:hypothetical protein [Acidimicrobiia bacterium]